MYIRRVDLVGISGYRVRLEKVPGEKVPGVRCQVSGQQLEFPLADPKRLKQRWRRRRYARPASADVAQVWFERMRQAAGF